MKHALIFGIRSRFERSTGSHRIATVLRNEGMDVEVIDFAYWMKLHQLQEMVKSKATSETLFFGFGTFFNAWTPELSEFTSWLKTYYPNIPRILGGTSVDFTPATDIDIWVDSFADNAIVEIARSLSGNSSSKLSYDINFLGRKKLVKSNVSYPAYPLSSYRIQYETRDYLQDWEWLTIEFSRGCKFKCDFCNFPILGVKGDYSRTQEDFELEMRDNYDRWGIKHYFVADETFNDSVEKIIKFADVAEKLEFRPFFAGFMRGDLVVSKRDSWEHLARLNMGGQYYGCETFNHESAKIIKKGMHPDKLQAGLLEYKNYMNRHGFFRATISFIIGLPKETEESLARTKAWLDKNWVSEAITVFPLTIEKAGDDAGYTNMSEFSKNLFKYGIREIPDAEIDKLTTNHRWNWKEGNYAKNEIVWEHDSMNIFQAKEIADSWQRDQINKFKLDMWQLSEPFLDYQMQVPLEKIKHMNRVAFALDRQTQLQLFVDKYIKRKLS